MAVAALPPPVDIDNDTKKAIIDGLKKVMTTFQEAGLLVKEATYQDLIAHPPLLMSFIKTFTDNRAMVDAVVRPRDGKAPVRDDDQVLICGVSLNQIQHLLVRTCAKKMFEQDKATELVTETVTTKSFLFFSKTEQVEVERPSNDPVEERKVREITRYVAFGWQLPLLEAYRTHLSYAHIMEIGDAMVALQRPEDIAAVGQFDSTVIKKVKLASGPDFPEILATQPQAIGGIAVWNRDMYQFYRHMLGDKAWTFFARDKGFFNIVAALEKATARCYGDVLCYISSANLEEIQRLNIDKTEVLVLSLKAAFGDKLPLILTRPAFAREVLRKVVDNLLHTNQEKDKLIASFNLTCKAMAPSVLEWLARQPDDA